MQLGPGRPLPGRGLGHSTVFYRGPEDVGEGQQQEGRSAKLQCTSSSMLCGKSSSLCLGLVHLPSAGNNRVRPVAGLVRSTIEQLRWCAFSRGKARPSSGGAHVTQMPPPRSVSEWSTPGAGTGDASLVSGDESRLQKGGVGSGNDAWTSCSLSNMEPLDCLWKPAGCNNNTKHKAWTLWTQHVCAPT